MSSDISYLSHLEYPPQLEQSFIAKYLGNIRIVILSILTIALLGVSSYIALPKRLNPELKIPIITIATPLPGASSQDVETLITKPIEDQLQTLNGVDQASSVSRENISFITLQFISTITPEKALSDVKDKVDLIALPDNAGEPQVKALDFENQPIWTFALSSDQSTADLMHAATKLKKIIEDLPKIDNVTTTGFTNQEIRIQLSPEKITQYQLSPVQILSQISSAIKTIPSGNLESDQYSFAVSVSPNITTVEDLRKLPILVNDNAINLEQLANISITASPNQAATFIQIPQQSPSSAVVFYVYKTTQSNITDAGTSVKTAVDEFIKTLPANAYHITTILNTSDEITNQFTDLLGEFRTTIILVFVTLLLFLGLRQAIISALTVPLTFLASFIILNMLGMSINFLVLFAFLLSLGLLVDDTIVVVSAMTSYYQTNKFTPYQTGLLVWRDTIVPIWSTTITTIWSFVPLLLSTGIIGEFIKPIPIVVTATMVSSTAIAVFITLPLMILLLRPSVPSRVKTLITIIIALILIAGIIAISVNTPLFIPIIITTSLLFIIVFIIRNRLANNPVTTTISNVWNQYSNRRFIHVEPFANAYYRFILRILASATSRKKVVIAIILYAVIATSLVPLGLVKNEFFPKTDENTFFIDLKLPSGTNLTTSQEKGLKILNLIKDLPYTEFITTEIGRTQSDVAALANSNNHVLYTIKLIDKDQRPVASSELAQHVREQFASFSDQITVIEQSGGPPAGADIQVTILGSDLLTLNQQADILVDHLKSQAGTINVAKSIVPGTSQLTFVPDQTKLAHEKLDPSAIANQIRILTSGLPISQIDVPEESTDKLPINLRLETQAQIQDIDRILISANQKNFPLSNLGKLILEPNPPSISHLDWQRAITVSAAVQPGYSINDVNTEFTKFQKTLTLPQGYSFQTGGINEENTKSVQSIMLAMVLAAILILVTMVIQFNSFRSAIIVILVIPLAVSSVFFVFALTMTPLSFPALIGILSLFGIVVTNSMFIVDKINLNRAQGMSFESAIADAGASRMEPIILTKLSTVLGLLPITIADPLWRGLGGAIISGLLLASTIMLLFIPVIYYQWMKPTPTNV